MMPLKPTHFERESRQARRVSSLRILGYLGAGIDVDTSASVLAITSNDARFGPLA